MKEKDNVNTKQNITTIVTIALGLCFGSQAIAQDEKPFYRGGFDGQIVEASILIELNTKKEAHGQDK
jgi:hypothetical protein